MPKRPIIICRNDQIFYAESNFFSCRIDQYCVGSGSFRLCRKGFVPNRLEAADDKHVAILISMLGPTAYNTLRTLLDPDKPKSVSLDRIKKTLGDHYGPQTITIAERFRFYKARQEEGETATQFAARLRKLARYCEFGTQLTTMLRDMMVCGLANSNCQKKLLTEKNLTFDKVLQTAISDEVARQDVEQFSQARNSAVNVSETLQEVQKISEQKPKSTRPRTARPRSEAPCLHCGRQSHQSIDCRFRAAKCHRCGRKGHIAPVCRQSSQAHHLGSSDSYRTSAAEEDPEELTSLYQLHSMDDSGNDKIEAKPFRVTLKIEDKDLEMELDTGSGRSIIGKHVFEENYKHLPMHRSNVTFVTYTKEVIKPLGFVKVKVNHNGQEKILNLYVVQNCRSAPPLLGREWLHQLRLDWSHIKRVSSGEAASDLQVLLQENAELFDDKLGKLRGIQAQLKVNAETKPIFLKARPISHARRQQVADKLTAMETEGIVKKVAFSEWAAPIVTPVKANGDVRI